MRPSELLVGHTAALDVYQLHALASSANDAPFAFVHLPFSYSVRIVQVYSSLSAIAVFTRDYLKNIARRGLAESELN